MSTRIIAKITLKDLGCNPKVASAKDITDKSTIPLAVIYGHCVDVKITEDNRNGQIYSALIGKFYGINIQQGNSAYGTQFEAGKCYLPGGIHETVESAVMGNDPQNPQNVDFALEIHAVRATNPIGYAYQAIPRLSSGRVTEDPLARIRAIVEQQIQLPAAPPPPPALPAPAAPIAGQIAAPAEVVEITSPAASVAPAAPAVEQTRQAAKGKR